MSAVVFVSCHKRRRIILQDSKADPAKHLFCEVVYVEIKTEGHRLHSELPASVVHTAPADTLSRP